MESCRFEALRVHQTIGAPGQVPLFSGTFSRIEQRSLLGPTIQPENPAASRHLSFPSSGCYNVRFMSTSNRSGAGSGTAKGGDEIISVEETVWSLQLGSRNPPCNVAKFEELWVGKDESKRKVQTYGNTGPIWGC